MNPQDKADFRSEHNAFLTLRAESELEARFDAVAAEVGPLVLAGIGLVGAEAAASVVPGGPLAVMAVELGASIAKGAFTRWLAKQKPKAPSA